jgi:glutamate racemase
VIQPAVRRAVALTSNGKVGVIGTTATINSKAYEDAFAAAVDIELQSVACPSFVEYVEAGVTSGPEIIAAAKNYLMPLKESGIDTLVLGCTHYPLLTGALSFVMGDQVTLVSSAEETAKDVYKVLMENDLLRVDKTSPTLSFRATGDVEAFEKLAKRFLGPEVSKVQKL